jgi:hypothetical protein
LSANHSSLAPSKDGVSVKRARRFDAQGGALPEAAITESTLPKRWGWVRVTGATLLTADEDFLPMRNSEHLDAIMLDAVTDWKLF